MFCRVVETGAFTRAADALEMPKSTVSKLIGGLEAHLQLKLLNRTTRTLQVTPDGAAYYEKVSHWLRELEDIDSAFAQKRIKPHGRIAVDVGAWLASAVIVPALPRFYEQYPDIHVELGVSDRTIDVIREKADCVIRGGDLRDTSLVGRQLGESPWMTAASPAYLRLHGVPNRPYDLETGHFLIGHQQARTGRTAPFRFERDGKEIAIAGTWRLSTNENSVHLAAGLAGLGVLQSFEWKLRSALREGRLVQLLSEWSSTPYALHVLYPPNRFMNSRLRVFIDWLVTVFAELRAGPI